MTYRDTSNYQPLGRQRRSTRLEKAVAGLAIVAGLLLLVSGYARHHGAPAYLKMLDWGIAPLGLVQFGMAWTYIERAGANRPEETYSQRALRLTALAFFLLGVVLVGVGIHDHFKGA
jgi:uncharacterized membrane protein (DUF485 family)